MLNQLYYGDNLQVLRSYIASESVDLIYLDPPFNSKRDYNLLFKSPKGQKSEAQIEAFADTWHWSTEVTEREYDEVLKSPNSDVGKMMKSLVEFLGRNDMTAYLVMMANRLMELHRTLKPTGSLYLHCDPTASHYLKIVLDAVFGKENFKTEINWRRSAAHNDAKQGRKQYGNVRDIIFFYTKSDKYTWNWLYTPYTEAYLESEYRHVANGRYFKETDPTANKPGGDVSFEWRVKRRVKKEARWEADLSDEYRKPVTGWEYQGVFPYQGRFWAYSKQNLIDFAKAGKLRHRKTGMPRIIQFADEMPGVSLQSDWQDIPPALGDEDLGYDTQKPVALLERIIAASSNEGDLVLDPFCGCGTAVFAAQKLARKWIGIDITCLAILLIESRLKKAFPEAFGEEGQRRLQYEVIGTPKDLESARDLAQRDKYQFQWWAVSLVDEAQPWQGKKKGADSGIDGIRYFRDLDRVEVHTILISVKGGENVGPTMVKDLIATLARDKADIGLFITLTAPTKAMVTEAAAAGFYESPNGKKYARLQLFTIEELLSKRKRPEHPDYEPNTGYKKAKAESNAEQGALL
jgi:DNA modification methylase